MDGGTYFSTVRFAATGLRKPNNIRAPSSVSATAVKIEAELKDSEGFNNATPDAGRRPPAAPPKFSRHTSLVK